MLTLDTKDTNNDYHYNNIFSVPKLTQDRYERKLHRTVKSFGYGATEAGLAIASTFIDETIDNVSSSINSHRKTTIKHLKDVFRLDPRQIALSCLVAGISSCVKNGTLSRMLFDLGHQLEAEVYAYYLNNWDSIKADSVRKACMKRGDLRSRKQTARSISARMGFALDQWETKETLKVGRWALEVLLEGSVFVLQDTEGRGRSSASHGVCLTEEAVTVASSLVSRLLDNNPVLLPLTHEPKPWCSFEAQISGYARPLVRVFNRDVRKALDGHIRSGAMVGALNALNAMQAVPWRINRPLLEILRWSFDTGLGVDGVPPINDLDLPPKRDDWESLSVDQQRHWRAKLGSIRERNRGLLGERFQLEQAIQTAQYLAGVPFYVPMNFDYRGRAYGIPSFNFQRHEAIRALFLFDRGLPMTPRGLYWLKVHAANCASMPLDDSPGAPKTDKIAFDDRAKWTQDNEARIRKVVKDPKVNLWWTKADKPFMFLAACMELVSCLDEPGRVCHLPVSFDGTCSGLQHLAAMSRDNTTALEVNLVDRDTPGDIYGSVASLVKQRIEGDLENPELHDLASLCLRNGITRKLVKRNVMTYSYGSARFGMANQLVEDTMRPLATEVLEGTLESHPYGQDGGWIASRYIAGHTHAAIEELVALPAGVMRYLQGLARVVANQNKNLSWTLPDGFLSIMRYHETVGEKVSVWLHDRGINHSVGVQAETARVDRHRMVNAMAPGFVHSYDAYHLRSVVNSAVSHGIRDVALVHDSFGCLPSQADAFRRIINAQFYELYQNHDVLRDIREQVATQVPEGTELPELPETGLLNISYVLNAPFAFA